MTQNNTDKLNNYQFVDCSDEYSVVDTGPAIRQMQESADSISDALAF